MSPAPVHPDSTRPGAPSAPESHADQHARLFNHEIQDTEDTNAEILAAAAEAREFLAANPGLKRSDPARYRAARLLLSIKPLRVPTWPKPRKPRPSLPSRPSSSSSHDSSSRSTSSPRASSSPSLPAPVTPPAPQAASHTAPRQSDALPHLASAVAPAPFVVKARPMGLRAGLDPSRLHDLADDLEAETFAVTTRKLRKTLKK